MRRGRRLALLALLGVLCSACGAAPPGIAAPPSRTATPASTPSSPSSSATPPPAAPALSPATPLPGQAAALAALPPGVPFTGQLLISDRGNDRLLMVDASGAVTWTFPAPGARLSAPFGAPDDAFFTPDGRDIIANAEGSQTVTAIDRSTGTILWQVGHNGVRGRGTGYFSEPDDAVPGPSGDIWVADIRNCRLVELGPGGQWLGVRGNETCVHNPPVSFAEPNGAFPTPGGSMVVTEIWGSRVTWLNPDGSVRWSVRTPAAYPSDALAYPDGSVLLTDYSNPGAVYRISPTGQVLWAYHPTGAAGLDHPSIAIPLASNRVAICDDWGSRIEVVDPSTGQVVWTFTGQGSSRLSFPDGLDYLP